MLRVVRQKPFMTGTSQTRQGDENGMIRFDDTPFHTFQHRCCTAVKEAHFLSIASIPGLSMKNINTHIVPINPDADHQIYGGFTLRALVEAVASDPSFNGHFVLWFLDNDNSHIMKYRNDPEFAVAQYMQLLSRVFQGIPLERLYLTTLPFREKDFIYNSEYDSIPLPFKIQFDKELRKFFDNDSGQINNIPVTLIRLKFSLSK